MSENTDTQRVFAAAAAKHRRDADTESSNARKKPSTGTTGAGGGSAAGSSTPNEGASSATVDPSVLEAMKEEIMGEMSKKYVSIETLQKEYVSIEAHNSFERRLDGITGVFEPATDYALFETCIYVFVAKKIPA